MPDSTPVPSEEQVAIVTAIKDGNNVIVDAVAGSGKTTTVLFLAATLRDRQILVVTYNSKLKQETRERCARLGNVEVHSYHSLGLAYYTRPDPCRDDTGLLRIINQRLPLKTKSKPSIIVLDETQDMTPLYYAFIKKAIADLNPGVQILVLGDTLQCIYDFPQKGADRRFLTLADQVFASPNLWVRRTLRTSYRITEPMAWYINERMLGYPRMVSVKPSRIPVRYVTGDPFHSVPNYLCDEIRLMLVTGVVEPDDIFVLAPSIRGTNELNPIKILENLLVKAAVPCYAPMSDDEALKDDVLKGKVVFSSFHQSKGLERKVVIVASFSTSYYFVARDAPREYCPNVLYVAATRAKEALYLWGEDTEKGGTKPLPFLRPASAAPKAAFEWIDLKRLKATGRKTPPTTPPPTPDSVLRRVTDLVRFIPEELTQSMVEMCKMVVRRPAGDAVDIPGTVTTPDGKRETVADLNGIAIPTMYEAMIAERISIQDDLKRFYLPTLARGDDFTDQRASWMAAATQPPQTPADFLRLANVYSAYQSTFLHKLVQIKDYDWLTQDAAEALLATLTATIKTDSNEILFEHTLEEDSYEFGNIKVHIAGRADLVDDETLWELKCTDELKAEHVIQLAIYAWLWRRAQQEHGSRRFCLHNIRTGEVQELTGVENLDYVVTMVLDNHFRTAHTLTDEEFVAQCGKRLVSLPGISPEPSQVRCLIVD